MIERLRALQRPIAFAHYSMPDDISGVTTWLRELLLRLHADGVPVVVLLHHLGHDPERSSLGKVLKEAGIAVEVQKRSSSMQVDLENVLDFLDRQQPAALLPQCLNVFYYAAASAGEQGLPWCMTLHSDDPDYWAIAEALPAEEHGGHTVCVSKHLTGELLQRGFAKKPFMIPYGVRIPRERATYISRPFTVAYSGRMLEEQKRISLVVSTLIRACQEDPRVDALLIGEGLGAQAAQALVNEAGLMERIRFTGRLAPEEVGHVLGACQAILLMSDYEGLPLSLLEAMALGLVPVVRNIPSGIPELVEDGVTGLLVEEDPYGAAKALVELVDKPQHWKLLSQRARERIEQGYSADMSYEGWVELLTTMIERSTPNYPLNMKEVQLPAPGTRLGKGYRSPPRKPSVFRKLVDLVKDHMRL